MGIAGALGHPIYYLTWSTLYPQEYESLALRLLMSAVCLPFAALPYWPAALKRWLRPIAFTAIMINLPFFFTYMMLRNDLSLIWLMSSLTAAFLMVLIVDWISMVLMSVLGTALAWIAYGATSDLPVDMDRYLEAMPIFLFVLVMATIFNYKSEMLRRERQTAIEALRAELADEIRGPMRGMKTGVTGLKTYLPTLLDAYQMARRADLEVPTIERMPLSALEHAADRIEHELDHVTAVLDVLLRDAEGAMLARESFERLSIAKCIESVLADFPYATPFERTAIEWRRDADFDFQGSHPLIDHVLTCLLRQGLNNVRTAGTGRVVIRVFPGVTQHRIELTDFGCGLSRSTVARLFEGERSGMDAWVTDVSGLSFCRKAMISMGGRITCRSELGEYTTFDLTLPAIAAARQASRETAA
jgi:two-component system CAI-1 autoinducer sensor kinase/phosphatase CqsS